MVTVLRFLGNVILALLLIALCVALLLAAGGVVTSRVWESKGLDYGVIEGQWLWIDEQPIYTQTWGPEDGPTLVIVHDADVAGMEAWRANAETLGKWGLRVIAVDAKGCGRSVRDTEPVYSLSQQTELLAKALNTLHVQGATVMGHGQGAAVALQLAAEQPQFVGQLILVAPRVYETAHPIWQPVAEVPLLGHAAAWVISSGGPYWLLDQRAACVEAGAVDREHWSRIQAPTHVKGTIAAQIARARSSPENDVPALLSRVQAPTLILMGALQSEAEQQEATQLAAALADAQIETIADAAGQPHLDQPTPLNRHLSSWTLASP